jgi:hypothetical protein
MLILEAKKERIFQTSGKQILFHSTRKLSIFSPTVYISKLQGPREIFVGIQLIVN